MPLARTQYTIRALMGVVAAAAVLIAGALLWLRDSPPLPKAQAPALYQKVHMAPVEGEGSQPEQPPLPRSREGGLIMEGVDINSNGAGPPAFRLPAPERDRSPRELRVPELIGGRPS
jgi:hypothetical protein